MAEVHTIEVPWGQVFPVSVDRGGDRAREAAPARPRAGRHVDHDAASRSTSSARSARKHGVLFYSDATASLGGNPFEADAWGLDAATAGLQKCLGGPSGAAPITLSDARGRGDPRRARKVEAGIREDGDADAADFIRSNYFDLGMILDYWGPRRLNHHTEATSMLYAARECARVLLLEGRDAAIERHRLHGDAMLAGVRRPRAGRVRRRRAQDEQRGRGRDPRRRAGRRRARRAAARTSASRSARRSARCTARSGASGRWATTPARTPCCRRSPRSRRCCAASARRCRSAAASRRRWTSTPRG